jgi:hypothetical protein
MKQLANSKMTIPKIDLIDMRLEEQEQYSMTYLSSNGGMCGCIASCTNCSILGCISWMTFSAMVGMIDAMKRLEEQEQYSRRTSLRFHNVRVPTDQKGNIIQPVDTDGIVLKIDNKNLNMPLDIHHIGRSHPIGEVKDVWLYCFLYQLFDFRVHKLDDLLCYGRHD